MVNKDISELQFVKSRMGLMNKFQELEELSLRSVSATDDAMMLDKSIAILQKRQGLIDTIQQEKVNIWQYIEFSAMKENGTINIMEDFEQPFDRNI